MDGNIVSKNFYQNRKYYILGFWFLKLCYYLLEICSYEPIKSQQFFMQIQDSINKFKVRGQVQYLVYCGKVIMVLWLQWTEDIITAGIIFIVLTTKSTNKINKLLM